MANQRLFIDIVARDKATKSLGILQQGLGRLRQSVFNLQNAFVGLGAGLVIRNLVNTGKNLENLRTRLKFLLKDTNEGAKAFENMTKFASRVPFSLEEIQSGSGILATVTDNANDLQKMLEITGNVAAVTGLDFRTAAEQIQRSFSAGIGAADLFREKGVRNMLGFKAGATVSIEDTVKAFERVFSPGGRFGKATDELAQTLEGTLSMIGDKVFNFKKTLLDAGFFSQLKRQFGDLDKFLVQNSESIERIAIGFGTVLAKAVEGTVNLFKSLKDNVDTVITVFKVLIAIKIVAFMISLGKAIVPVLAGLRGLAGLSGVGLALVAASVAATTATFIELNKQIDKTIESLGEAVDKNISMRSSAREMAILMRSYKKEVKEVVELTNREAGIIKHQQQELQTVKRIFEDMNNKELENINLKMKNINKTIAEGINSGITKMSQALAQTLVFGKSLSDTLANMARNVLARIIAVLIEQIARQAIIIAMENTQIGQLATKLGIEKLITAEKVKQSSVSTVSAGSSLMGLGSLKGFFGMAKGGAVSKNQPYVVGENGPELFVPNQTGQITQNARGTSGGQTTVNFNINTVDASGFEDLLVRSRGTITQLINNAVNERGKESLI
jgi:prepilin signal peptidase PulO-like enzyme (type II secretory pathway)